jgi:flagellar biosynthesis repressor protein FlbT
MNPHDLDEARAVYRQQRSGLLAATQNAEILDGLEQIENLVVSKRYYEALRKARALFEVEQLILAGGDLPRPVEVA